MFSLRKVTNFSVFLAAVICLSCSEDSDGPSWTQKLKDAICVRVDRPNVQSVLERVNTGLSCIKKHLSDLKDEDVSSCVIDPNLETFSQKIEYLCNDNSDQTVISGAFECIKDNLKKSFEGSTKMEAVRLVIAAAQTCKESS